MATVRVRLVAPQRLAGWAGRCVLHALAVGCLLAAVTTPALSQEPEFIADHPELILSAEQAWGVLGLNVAAHAPDKAGEALRIGQQTYSRGLGHHANGTITVWLDGRYRAFDADVGLQPCAGGTVVFKVLVNGTPAAQSGTMHSGEAPKQIHVELPPEAQELTLEAKDAGDGITCDMANWAEARLTPGGTARERAEPERVNVAAFGRVAQWDPNRADGARASRIEEFRAEDVFTETELKPHSDGSFTVPTTANGTGCIGVQWLNRRNLRQLDLECVGKAALPASNGVRVEGWFGESAWQGSWKPLEGVLETKDGGLSFRPAKGRLQTQKIRWVLPNCSRDSRVKLSAFTHSIWGVTNLLVQVEEPAFASRAHVDIYDGEILSADGTARSTAGMSWAGSRPTRIRVHYSRPSSLNSDPTELRFQLGGQQVAVAVSDVLNHPCVYVPDIRLFVTRDPAPVTLAEYKRQIADKKTVLREVRAMPDQSLDQAMARTHHEFQSEGPVMLSLACDNTKFIVDRDGTVHFNPDSFEWLGMHQQVDWQPWYATSCELRPQFGDGTKVKFTRRLDGGWLPVPEIAVESGGIRYSQRSLVAPLDPAATVEPLGCKPSVCEIAFTAYNPGTNRANARLKLSFGSSPKGKGPVTLIPSGHAYQISVGGEAVGVVQANGSGGEKIDATEGVLSWERELGAGEKGSLVVRLAGEGNGPQILARLVEAGDLRVATESYWKAVLESAIQIETPDDLLNNLIRSSQVRCLIDARSEDEGARFAASIAAMSYGPLESEAHSVIRGMDYLGHSEFARRSLDFFVHRYNTNGFLTTGYTTFGTAWHLWTLGEHYELTRDTNWFRGIAPEVARVCQWVIRQTEKTRRMDPFGQPVPESGLMPPGVLADWNAFAYHYAMNAYYVAGLKGAALALREAGHPEANRIAEAAKKLRQNTLRAYAWTQARSPALGLRDGTWIPAYPSQVHSPGKLADFFPGQDAGRSWCYDVEIGAHQLVPTGVLDPHSREVERLLDHMEDVQFLSDGWFDYPADQNHADWFNLGGFSKVQPYYTRNCEVYALRDDVKPFVRSYFNSIASLLNPEVLTFWEHFHHSGAWDKTHETGYFLHQTRTMLVQERNDELWLAPFLTERWLEDGKKVSVRNAPTQFGLIGFEITSHIGSGYIEARIDPPVRRRPAAIVLRLRHPQGRKIRAVTVDGRPLRSWDPAGRTVALTRFAATPIHLSVNY